MSRAVTSKKPDPLDIRVGQRVRARRLVCGMSQTALGQHLGITFQQVQKYEKGTNRIGASRLQRIAEVLDVPAAFFLEKHDDAKGVPSGGSDGFELLSTARGVRLMRAFSRISNPGLQEAVVSLCEMIAEGFDR